MLFDLDRYLTSRQLATTTRITSPTWRPRAPSRRAGLPQPRHVDADLDRSARLSYIDECTTFGISYTQSPARDRDANGEKDAHPDAPRPARAAHARRSQLSGRISATSPGRQRRRCRHRATSGGRAPPARPDPRRPGGDRARDRAQGLAAAASESAPPFFVLGRSRTPAADAHARLGLAGPVEAAAPGEAAAVFARALPVVPLAHVRRGRARPARSRDAPRDDRGHRDGGARSSARATPRRSSPTRSPSTCSTRPASRIRATPSSWPRLRPRTASAAAASGDDAVVRGARGRAGHRAHPLARGPGRAHDGARS